MLSLMKCLVAILFWEYLHFFKLRKCYYWDIIDKELRWKYPSPLLGQKPHLFPKIAMEGFPYPDVAKESDQ